MFIIMRWFLAAALVCADWPAHADGPVIQLRDVAAAGSLSIGRLTSDYRDATGKLDFEQVSLPARSREFTLLTHDRPNFGYERAHHWLRFTIDPGAAAAALMLEVGLASLDLVELHTPQPGAGYAVQKAGDQLPWNVRAVPHRNHVFRLNLEAGRPAVLYLHVASANTLTVPLTLWTAEAFQRHERHAQLGFGIFYGLIIALFLYNLVLFVSLRDIAYLWYVVYAGTFGLALFSLDGFAFEHLWPESIRWANHALGAFFSLALMFGGLFARAFLGTAKHEPRLDVFMCLVIGAAAFLVLCSLTGWLLDNGALLRGLSFIAPLGALLTLWLGVKAMLRGYAPARYFLLAWSSLLFFVVLGALRNFALVPAGLLATYGLHIGLALDVILLSSALAARIRTMQGEMIGAQQELLRSTRAHQVVLEQRARELADTNRELEAFSHTVAHDLRAPLRAIDGFANLLEREHRDALPESGRRDIGLISRNARRMALLVDGLLEFSRLGRIAPGNVRVGMDSIVQSVIQEQADVGKATISVAALPAVSGDAVLLRQVWVNLIGNAVKFSARADAPAVDISASVTATEVVFRVSDNGAGFDPAYAGKLFGMFQRLHAAADFEGTGVGLATVRRIVERHGGRVDARSEAGRGATFEFALPTWRLADSPPDARPVQA